ncbi:MAG: hypothetical protein J6X00_02420 [Clostridia bacterium]|nr:hypothetical protein [Clostridia bacterium]
MRYLQKIVICVLICICVCGISACQKTTDTMEMNTPATQDVQVDENVVLLDGATTLEKNGDYYESGALSITQGKKYVFKLTNNKLGHNVSTLYMYNAKERMGNAFLDGTTEKQNLEGAYWNVKVYDSNKNYIDFATLHPLSSQMSWSDSWDDVYEFEQNATYYFVLDIIKTKSGNWYFSIY